jgi:hypothetical protein
LILRGQLLVVKKIHQPFTIVLLALGLDKNLHCQATKFTLL